MDEKEHKNLNALKRGYLMQKHDNILDHCFALCTDKGKPGSSLTGKQITCVGTLCGNSRKLWDKSPQRVLVHV